MNAAFETLPGTNFIVYGAPIPHDSALVSAGAKLLLAPNWSVLAKFDGEFACTAQTHAGTWNAQIYVMSKLSRTCG